MTGRRNSRRLLRIFCVVIPDHLWRVHDLVDGVWPCWGWFRSLDLSVALGQAEYHDLVAPRPAARSTAPFAAQYHFVARGFGLPGDFNTRVLLSINGNRANDVTFDQALFGREFPLDMDLIERIEFIPGPGGAV